MSGRLSNRLFWLSPEPLAPAADKELVIQLITPCTALPTL